MNFDRNMHNYPCRISAEIPSERCVRMEFRPKSQRNCTYMQNLEKWCVQIDKIPKTDPKGHQNGSKGYQNDTQNEPRALKTEPWNAPKSWQNAPLAPKWSPEAKVQIWDGFSNDFGIHFGSTLVTKFMQMLKKTCAKSMTEFYHKMYGKPCRNGYHKWTYFV